MPGWEAGFSPGRIQMSDVAGFLWVVLGVSVAVLFPVVRGFIKKEFPPTAGSAGLPPGVRRYGGLLLFSVVTGLVVFAIYKSQVSDEELAWHSAFLLGFGWEALIEKFLKPA
jgi:hypothetical protein